MKYFVNKDSFCSVEPKYHLRKDRSEVQGAIKKNYIEIRQNASLFAILMCNILIINIMYSLGSCHNNAFICILRQMILCYIVLVTRYLSEIGMLPNNNDRYYAFLA
jgi:hypothetical protein